MVKRDLSRTPWHGKYLKKLTCSKKRLPYEIYEVSAQRISIGGYFEQ